MYTPAHYQMTDRAECVAFMRRFSFATLITAKNKVPSATHLPFIIRDTGEEIVLASHFAKANRQWEEITGSEVLVIFQEPHAYISPQHYEKILNVPTWNYLAVHVYGKGEIITDAEESIALLEETIRFYEEAYFAQWQSLPASFKDKMRNGIVPFLIRVSQLQGKKKLSQNKTEQERGNIISAFASSHSESEQLIAEYMQAQESRH